MKRFFAIALITALVLGMAVPAVGVARQGKSKGRATGKPTFVSHPYTKHSKLKINKDFKTWGYVKTWKRAPLTQDATLTIRAQKWNSGTRSWEASAGLMTTATISPTGKFKKKTNYSAVMNIGSTGRYRLRAKLVWMDAKGVEHTKWSSRKYLKLVK